jgi:hypothetical protein
MYSNSKCCRIICYNMTYATSGNMHSKQSMTILNMNSLQKASNVKIKVYWLYTLYDLKTQFDP